MSALLSNIYMTPFDVKMQDLVKSINGMYLRYSDDILVICDPKFKNMILTAVTENLKERGPELFRNEGKDQFSLFEEKPMSKTLLCSQEFQYLGFSYDGKSTRIRSSSLAKYHRKLKFAVRGTKKNADAINAKKAKTEKLFRKKLNFSLTHLGKKGFIGGYARKASKEMSSTAITRQIKGSLERLNKEITKLIKHN